MYARNGELKDARLLFDKCLMKCLTEMKRETGFRRESCDCVVVVVVVLRWRGRERSVCEKGGKGKGGILSEKLNLMTD
ncbi:hypothetical protein Scep_021363 [Stephania cephalantha]|uniref:Uncharacterized protein n=1 Tax=Stephania cephalantha TaxID=152367 RepID=A0AAP0I1U0_9MAGN